MSLATIVERFAFWKRSIRVFASDNWNDVGARLRAGSQEKCMRTGGKMSNQDGNKDRSCNVSMAYAH